MARKLTDNRLNRIEDHIRAIYDDAATDIESTIKSDVAKLEREEKKRKEKEKRQKDFIIAFVIGSATFAAAKSAIIQRLIQADKQAINYINSQIADIFVSNYNAMNAEIASNVFAKTKHIYSWTPASKSSIALYLSQTGLYRNVDELKVKAWADKKIVAEVINGIQNGESIPKIAKRIKNVTGMEKRYAITNARTMVTGAENAGRLKAMEDAISHGVEVMKRWISTHDNRVRDWHDDLDGVMVDVNDSFENDYGEIRYPGDPEAEPGNVYNCRCSLGTEIIGFRDKDGHIIPVGYYAREYYE